MSPFDVTALSATILDRLVVSSYKGNLPKPAQCFPMNKAFAHLRMATPQGRCRSQGR
jgi:hypothetical protein